MTTSGPNPFKTGNSLPLKNGVPTVIVPPIPDSYRDYLFEMMFLNQGSNGITVSLVDNNGSSAFAQQVMTPGGPGPAESNVPWEKIAGGIIAEASGGDSQIQFDVWSGDIKREALLLTNQDKKNSGGGIITETVEERMNSYALEFPVI